MADFVMTVSAEHIGMVAEEHRASLLRVACRVTRDRLSAEDAVQDAVMSAMENREEFQGAASLKSYLFRLVINKSIDAGRWKLRWRNLLSRVRPDDLHMGNEPVADEAEAYPVRQWVDALPDKFRLPLMLVEFEELSYHEVADILHVSTDAVRMRVFKARERLRAKLNKAGGRHG